MAVPAALAIPFARPPAAVADAAQESVMPLPTRKLGRNGPDVPMIALGCESNGHSPAYLDIAWAMGIRYFDTADCYLKGKSESVIKDWLAQHPERRKDLFLVSKDHPRKGLDQMMELLDKRLEALGTSYLDLFFVHGINPREYTPESLNWPKSAAFQKMADALKSSGKVKMVGFSCHDDMLTDYLDAAGKGGIVDAIMFKYSPFFTAGDRFDQGIEACHKAGIGMVAMKIMRNAADIPKRVPEFDKMGLTTHQALLHSVWGDPRISAVCTRITNVTEMDLDVRAAHSFKTALPASHIALLKEIVTSHRRTMCPGCPSCRALGAAMPFAFSDISRFVTYYEQDGDVAAGEQYRAIPASSRDASGVDLASLRDACAFKTDYPEIIRRAERYFAAA